MTKPSNILVSTMKRNQAFRGPASSAHQNAFQDEVIRDLTLIQKQHNSFIVPLSKTLPDGSQDPTVNAFQNGLDGRTLFVHADAVNSGGDARYYNSGQGRPRTVHEQFVDSYTYVDDALQALENDLASAGLAGGISTQQKERIGLNVFDSSLVSSPSSLDGKTIRNELNLLQVAKDLYGSPYVAFNGAGNPQLTNSLRAMVDALLELHAGNWDDDITLGHTISAADITTGTFGQNRVGPSSSSGGVNDSYAGSPANLLDDLNQVRTLLKQLKGTGAFSSVITPDATWNPVPSAPSTMAAILALKGSGARSSTNPWGVASGDIEGLGAILGAEENYTGRASSIDDTPSYSAVNGFSQGDSLVTAIGGLAGNLTTVTSNLGTTTNTANNHVANTSNPHSVTLTQVAAEGGSAPASLIDITDTSGYFTSATVEEALEESWEKITEVSGVLTNLASSTSSSSFRRLEVNLTSWTASQVINHNAGMYPQVQVINLSGGGQAEPISQVSGVWITHSDNNSLTIENLTGGTIAQGVAVLLW